MRRSPTEERLLSAFRDAVQAEIEVERITREGGSTDRAEEDLEFQENRFLRALRDYGRHIHTSTGIQLHLPVNQPEEI